MIFLFEKRIFKTVDIDANFNEAFCFLFKFRRVEHLSFEPHAAWAPAGGEIREYKFFLFSCLSDRLLQIVFYKAVFIEGRLFPFCF